MYKSSSSQFIRTTTGKIRTRHLFFKKKKNGIHSMQYWKATKRYGVMTKRNTKNINAYREFVKKEPTVTRCLLILDFTLLDFKAI